MWIGYKLKTRNPMTIQQIELTLKQLNNYRLLNHNIVYLIETSIARGYKGVMEPTQGSVCMATKPELKYESDEYIVPETTEDKLKLRNYLERCYMFEKIDPRTKLPLTEEQMTKLKEHWLRRKKQHLSFTDYIYQHEVLTGTCLLE